MCTVYAIEALQALARELVCQATLEKFSGDWGSALWNLLLAEPEGASYWVRLDALSYEGEAILWSVALSLMESMHELCSKRAGYLLLLMHADCKAAARPLRSKEDCAGLPHGTHALAVWRGAALTDQAACACTAPAGHDRRALLGCYVLSDSSPAAHTPGG